MVLKSLLPSLLIFPFSVYGILLLLGGTAVKEVVSGATPRGDLASGRRTRFRYYVRAPLPIPVGDIHIKAEMGERSPSENTTMADWVQAANLGGGL